MKFLNKRSEIFKLLEVKSENYNLSNDLTTEFASIFVSEKLNNRKDVE